jgi:hypothetical protein
MQQQFKASDKQIQAERYKAESHGTKMHAAIK